MRTRIEVQYNDGLDTWVKRFSNRRLADAIATSIREHDIAARVHDRGYKGIKRSERYEIRVERKDVMRALSLANHYIQVYGEINDAPAS